MIVANATKYKTGNAMKKWLLVTFIIPVCLNAQTNIPGLTQTGKLVPQEIIDREIYFALLHEQIIFDKLADDENKKGNTQLADDLRSSLRKSAGLNETDGAILRQTIDEFKTGLDAINNKMADIKSKRTALTPNSSNSVSPDILQLNQEREDLVWSSINSLKAQLSEFSFSKLDKFAHKIVSSKSVDIVDKPNSKIHTNGDSPQPQESEYKYIEIK